MKATRKIEIEELSGAWVITVGDKSTAYSQHPQTSDDIRLVKDLLRHLELSNQLEIREKASLRVV